MRPRQLVASALRRAPEPDPRSSAALVEVSAAGRLRVEGRLGARSVGRTAVLRERESGESVPIRFVRAGDDPEFEATLRCAVGAPLERPEALRVPITVAWAEHDRLLPTRTQAGRARRRLPQARHTLLRGCGHVPTYDDPAQVAAVLRAAMAARA